MQQSIKYLLYVNKNVMGVFNTLYSETYLFQYITRAVIVRCFDAALFPCFFFIITYCFFIWLILCKVSVLFCFIFVFF